MAEVLGIIGSVISILTAAEDAYGRIKTMRGLPEAFTVVSRRILLAQEILAKVDAHSKTYPESTANAIDPTIYACKSNADALKTLLEKLHCGGGSSTWSVTRYVELIKSRGNMKRVEDLMRDILEDIQQLANHEAVNAVTQDQLTPLRMAIQEVGSVEESVPDAALKDAGVTYITQNSNGGAQANQVGPRNTAHNNFGNGSFHINYGQTSEQMMRELEKRKAEVLRRLNCAPYKKHKNNNPEAMSNTCQWFIGHETFQYWIRSAELKLLWVSADPGCGKSVLARYLIDQVLESMASPTRIIYFFFKVGLEDQNTAEGALRCLLHQVLEEGSNLFTEAVLKSLEELGETRSSSFDDLWDILMSVLSHHNAGQTICVLDALDECTSAGWSRMTAALSNFRHSKISGLKFLFLSRPYVNIETSIHTIERHTPTIHLCGEDEREVNKISEEINKVIKERVERLKISKEDQNLICKRLIRAQNRTYLWVHIVCEMLPELCKSAYDLEAILARLPRTVQQAYNDILCQSSNINKAKAMLHIIVAATRPLSLEEMATAMAIENDDFPSSRRLAITDTKRFEEQMRDICGLFVVVVNGQVYLIHQTARDFLVRKGDWDDERSSKAVSELDWESSLCLHESHRIIASICVRYLVYAEERKFGPQHSHRRRPGRRRILPAGIAESVDLSKNGLVQYAKLFPLFDYSAKYWTAHYRRSKIKRSSELDDDIVQLCDTTRPGCLTWYWYRRYHLSQVDGTDNNRLEGVFPTRNIYPRLEPLAIFYGSNSLLLASYLGIRRVVDILLDKPNQDINATDSYTSIPALSWAAASGYRDVVGLLLKKTKAQIAPFGSNQEADTGLCDEYGQTPLMFASMNGNEHVVEALLRTRKSSAEINRQDMFGRTALSHAAERGHVNVVRLLFLEGAEGEIKLPPKYSRAGRKYRVGTTGRQPLSYAAGGGHIAVVELLVKKAKVTVDCRSWTGRTALAYAAIGGYAPIFQFLIDKGDADINQKDNDKKTPLLHAVINDRASVVRILHSEMKLSLGLTRTKVYSSSPLYESLEHESVEVFRYFLKTEDLEARSKRIWEKVGKPKEDKKPAIFEEFSLLEKAVERKKLGIVEVLLTEGADITSVPRPRRYSFLWYVVAARNVRIAELLLGKRRINLDLTGFEYRSLISAELWNQESKNLDNNNVDRDPALEAREKEDSERIRELLDEYVSQRRTAENPETHHERHPSLRAPRLEVRGKESNESVEQT